MDELAVEKIIDGIKRGDKKILHKFYLHLFPSVEKFVLKNRGNTFDAEDVFQDTFIVIHLKVKKTDFAIRTSFSNYFFSVAKYIWLKELKKKLINSQNISEIQDIEDVDCNIHQEFIKMERRKLILEHYRECSPECQRLLQLFIDKLPIGEITKIMGYSSDQYTRNRRTACKARLIRKIWSNPRYKELRSESIRKSNKIPRW